MNTLLNNFLKQIIMHKIELKAEFEALDNRMKIIESLLNDICSHGDIITPNQNKETYDSQEIITYVDKERGFVPNDEIFATNMILDEYINSIVNEKNYFEKNYLCNFISTAGKEGKNLNQREDFVQKCKNFDSFNDIEEFYTKILNELTKVPDLLKAIINNDKESIKLLKEKFYFLNNILIDSENNPFDIKNNSSLNENELARIYVSLFFSTLPWQLFYLSSKTIRKKTNTSNINYLFENIYNLKVQTLIIYIKEFLDYLSPLKEYYSKKEKNKDDKLNDLHIIPFGNNLPLNLINTFENILSLCLKTLKKHNPIQEESILDNYDILEKEIEETIKEQTLAQEIKDNVINLIKMLITNKDKKTLALVNQKLIERRLIKMSEMIRILDQCNYGAYNLENVDILFDNLYIFHILSHICSYYHIINDCKTFPIAEHIFSINYSFDKWFVAVEEKIKNFNNNTNIKNLFNIIRDANEAIKFEEKINNNIKEISKNHENITNSDNSKYEEKDENYLTLLKIFNSMSKNDFKELCNQIVYRLRELYVLGEELDIQEDISSQNEQRESNITFYPTREMIRNVGFIFGKDID